MEQERTKITTASATVGAQGMGHLYQKSHVTNFWALHRGKSLKRDAHTSTSTHAPLLHIPHPSQSVMTLISDWCWSQSICCWFWPMPRGGNSTLRKKNPTGPQDCVLLQCREQSRTSIKGQVKKVNWLHVQPHANISYCNSYKKVEIVFCLYMLEWKIWRTKCFWRSGHHLKLVINTLGSSRKCLSFFPTHIPDIFEKILYL